MFVLSILIHLDFVYYKNHNSDNAPKNNMFALKNEMVCKSGSSMTVAGEVWCTFWTAPVCCSSADFYLSSCSQLSSFFKIPDIMIM